MGKIVNLSVAIMNVGGSCVPSSSRIVFDHFSPLVLFRWEIALFELVMQQRKEHA